MGVDHQQHGDGAIEAGKVAYNPKHRLLLGADHIGRADKLGGAAEFGTNPGGEHFGNRFATLNQRAGVGFDTSPGFNRQRLPGEHGLVEQDQTLADTNVRRNHRAETELDDVPRYQFGSGQNRPKAVAQH
ncbi:hypothetical protein GALL_546100 [mine drainage metagenome]|uniref:Uncharacterized protein n=1 Tax=mine drainage metagenome TaxID=410659 RepID=A0A1J5NYH5_9ZZZZ